MDGPVIQALGQPKGFEPFELRHLTFLPFDIAGVLDPCLHLGGNLHLHIRKGRIQAPQVFEKNIAPLEELRHGNGIPDRG